MSYKHTVARTLPNFAFPSGRMSTAVQPKAQGLARPSVDGMSRRGYTGGPTAWAGEQERSLAE
jgi:hypothetical protein